LVINPATDEYQVDDQVESNNGDVRTVFYTVVSTLTDFFEIHPNGTVYIEGSTPQRMIVYHKLVVRHFKQIETIYKVRGFTKGRLEDFQIDSDYDFILISYRNPLH
jgi:hypothetical protein